MTCILGLDIGTTSTIGILLRLPDRILGIVSRPVTLRSPQPGWAEEDPAQWWSNVAAITQELLAKTGVGGEEIAAVGVTGMLPAVVLLDEAGTVLRPSIQQSDARCGAQVEAIRAEVEEADFIRRAGNGVNQQLVTAKLRWLEENEPAVFARVATVFGSYDYINWRLTGRRAVEQNWALEGGFVDIRRHEIDDGLVALGHLPAAAMPPKIASHEILGAVTEEAARETGLAAGTPVVGGAADLIASALAAGVVEPGQVLLKFGGSVDVLVATATATPDPRLYLDYHLVPGLFMPNGCMSTGGSGLNWFAQTFAQGEAEAAQAAGLTLHQHLDRLAEAVPPGAEGVQFLPYLLGEKTPIHDPAARGKIVGLSLFHGLGHLWRALLEGYAYAILHHIDVLNDIGYPTEVYLASDGGSNSRVWMQIVADVLQKPVQRLEGHPGSCLGAAWTAAIGAGLEQDWAGIGRFVRKADLIAPRPAFGDLYAAGYRSFRSLYAPGTECAPR